MEVKMLKTTKKSKAATTANPNTLDFARKEGESPQDSYGRNVILTIHGNAITIHAFSAKYGEDLPLMGIVNALRDQAERIHGGDLNRMESILISQAHTLDAIFNNLAHRAALCMAGNLDTTDTYLRLALKAQSQCRTTLETLTAIKNPPIIYAKQANFAAGPQQVNNGAPAQAGKNKKSPNELLEQKPYEWLDSGEKGAAGSANSEVEAMEPIKRAEIARG